jgi:hypothetical protein
MRHKRRIAIVAGCALALAALIPAASAIADKHRNRNATPVFDLQLRSQEEVPRVRGLRADARGSVTFDLTRNSSGVITSGEVVFYVNYEFAGPVTITGLHIHQGRRGTNGPIVVDSGVANVVEPDGDGNVTTVITGVSPSLLQAILDKPRDYYVNLHTTDHPAGAIRDQLDSPGDSRGGGKDND